MNGVKYDNDKLRWSLLPFGPIQEVIKVLMYGSKKYEDDNWKKVDNAKERYFNAAMRHLTEWWEGEKLDDETGISHLAHSICCLLFLLWFEGSEKDDNCD
jgi:hypothetical protein